MCFSIFLRVGVWRNIWRAYRRGFRGNLGGEGLVLGGVFVIGPGDQVGCKMTGLYYYIIYLYYFLTMKCICIFSWGINLLLLLFQGILLEHREREFGDKVNMLAVLRTARKMRDDMAR